MDSYRAKQIIESKDLVQVVYQGNPVWLENLKEDNMAEVIKIEDREKIEVPVLSLVESHTANRNV